MCPTHSFSVHACSTCVGFRGGRGGILFKTPTSASMRFAAFCTSLLIGAHSSLPAHLEVGPVALLATAARMPACGCVRTHLRPVLMGPQDVSRLSKYCCQEHLRLACVHVHMQELSDAYSSDGASENDPCADGECGCGLSWLDTCFGGDQEKWAFKSEPSPPAVPPSHCPTPPTPPLPGLRGLEMWRGTRIGHLTFAL